MKTTRKYAIGNCAKELKLTAYCTHEAEVKPDYYCEAGVQPNQPFGSINKCIWARMLSRWNQR
jgi:hypothetical protein